MNLLKICLICLSLNVGTAFCQDMVTENGIEITTEPMLFMGIPMRGPVTVFVKKLETKGLKFDMINDNGLYVMKGLFVGHTASVLLQPLADGDICRVQVLFSDQGQYFTSWRRIYDVYKDIKDRLIEKYGKPHKCIEKFLGIKPSGDLKKIIALHQGKCNYSCTFTFEGEMTSQAEYVSMSLNSPIGNIFLDISEDQLVKLTYVDISQEIKLDDQYSDDL